VPRRRAYPATFPISSGADDAAGRLAELDVWHSANVVKANPDRAQLPLRVRALRAGKLIFVAVPRLATPKPFYRLDPAVLPEPFEQTATGNGAANAAPTVGVDEMPPVDLVVCGSVAVNRRGVRVGKGAGYSDIEVALLVEVGLITSATTIVTTVHRASGGERRATRGPTRLQSGRDRHAGRDHPVPATPPPERHSAGARRRRHGQRDPRPTPVPSSLGAVQPSTPRRASNGYWHARVFGGSSSPGEAPSR
jgi:5-formyltetrahydrofolate cyclo-ligase